MAEVILARVQGIEGFERHVVIKKIRDECARDDRFVQMFLDEARLAASLHHNNIVHVHDIGQEDGEYFFTMEYVHGEDLRRVLAHLAQHDRRMPLDFCVTIGLATAAALHHAHEARTPDRSFAGIVHRDVSPANILVAYDGNVKVVDFGIAKLAQRTEETGLMKGKVAYMSPEQCLGHDVDRRSDIFCLGIVLYELATVRRLFKGANDFLTMTSITHGRIPRPSEIRPDVPPELEAIILKALAYKPEDRYQTADEMRAALERFAVSANLQTSTTALADFMRAEFGERDVPWMVAEDEPELSIDFDGSGAGIVAAPKEAVEATSGSIVQALDDDEESGAVTQLSTPHALKAALGEDLAAVSSIAAARRSAMIAAPSKTRSTPVSGATAIPAAASISLPATPRRKRRGLVLGVAGVAAVGIAAAAVLMMGSTERTAPASLSKPAPAAAPASEPKPVTPPNMMPSAQDPASPPTPPSAEVTTPAPSGTDSAPSGTDPAPSGTDSAPSGTDATPGMAVEKKNPARPGKRPVLAPVKKQPQQPPQPAPKGVWDPKALLPPSTK